MSRERLTRLLFLPYISVQRDGWVGSGRSLRKLGETGKVLGVGFLCQVAPRGAGTDLGELGVELFRGEHLCV